MTDHETDLEQKIKTILHRNERVEKDKSWETSSLRRGTIVFLTWLGAFVFLKIIQAPNAGWAAFVPALGYVLSTLSLRPLRKIWETFHRK